MAYQSIFSGTELDSILTNSKTFNTNHVERDTVSNIPPPTETDDAVNKNYIDDLIKTINNNITTINNKISSLESNISTTIQSNLTSIQNSVNNLADRVTTIEGYFNTQNKITTFLNGMPTKTLPDGSNWCRIFYHNVNSGTQIFGSKDEALNCNTTYKKSQLYRIEDFKDNNGKFELMLCYPNYSSGYNRWKQTSNLVTTPEASVTGKEAISTSFTDSGWSGGIGLSASGDCYWDGSSNGTNWSNWWYAIASTANYNNGIPGPGVVINSVTEIWIRYDDAAGRL